MYMNCLLPQFLAMELTETQDTAQAAKGRVRKAPEGTWCTPQQRRCMRSRGR
jgi:hypothetical protein